MSQPRTICEIELRGSFAVNWADYFGDVLVHAQMVEGTIRSTTLIFHPVDPEAFLGALHMLIDRGFPILACEYRADTRGKPQVARPAAAQASPQTPAEPPAH
jgi:hypothetical protein